ncbi:hypothetical protein DRE_06016 [Drechslerella stenobrocha 248]|uniref:Uncharacterized protein n=1 Tax=Drechslerella stenobrocha 248 TaxID=1043628 RepID=W7HQ60_9PEZI|nr:hypothetical protein DRE_06016 [Drechslerella stenobrocha 248]
MRPGVHRFLLPPALLGLHGLLLLPILIPYRPDSSSYPDSSLNFALHSAPYAVPLACLAFASVALLRLLASSQCLPTAVLLFLLGVLEEAVRWSLVRCLSDADGGGGGYGATHPEPDNHGPLSRGGYRLPASNSIEVAPGIWEGVYIMGWTWSALESMHIWWLLRPATAASSSAAAAVDDLPISSRPHSYHSWRKEHAKKRSTDSTIRTIRGFPKNQMEQSSPNDRRYPFLEENTFVQPGFLGTFDERARASSPEVSRRCVREEDNDAGDEETSATDNDNDGMDSPLTPINYRAAVPTHSTRPLPEDEDDEQEESTPTQQKHNARFFTSSSLASESDYLGQREPTWAFSNPISPNRQALDKSRRLNPATSDSEAESTQSGTQTPLLSSSIPLEQEQTSLLDHSPASHKY